MTEPTELLPCPFCSGVAHIADDLITFYGECGTCGATSDYSSYKAGAVANWNRRTPAPVGVEPAAWKHDCAALLTNDVELWIDACPHCGKPRNAPQPAGRAPLPGIKPGDFFGGRPEYAMEIDPDDFYGITEAIHHAIEMLNTHKDANTDWSPLDPKRSRRLQQACYHEPR